MSFLNYGRVNALLKGLRHNITSFGTSLWGPVVFRDTHLHLSPHKPFQLACWVWYWRPMMGDSFAEAHSGYPRQLHLQQSGARIITWGEMKRMEKTRNNGFNTFSPIPNLAFLCTASTLQLPLHTLLANKDGESGQGIGQGCFALLTLLKD